MNADILDGDIADSTTLNLYAYVNGNPISYVDPFGMEAVHGQDDNNAENFTNGSIVFDWNLDKFGDQYFIGDITFQAIVNEDTREALYIYLQNGIIKSNRPNNIGIGVWEKYTANELCALENALGSASTLAKGARAIPYISLGASTLMNVVDNVNAGASASRIATDALVDVTFGISGIALTTQVGAAIGSLIPAPGVGTLVGAGVGTVVGVVYYGVTEAWLINGKSIVDWTKEWTAW